MIDRVHFESFQCLRDVTLDLRRFTALVGANGCGKSSVLLGMPAWMLYWFVVSMIAAFAFRGLLKVNI